MQIGLWEAKKVWLNVWRTAVQLFNVAVVLIVFSQLYNQTQIIIVALFGLTYVAIRAGFIANAMMMRAVTIGMQQEIDIIKNAVVPDFHFDPSSVTTMNKAAAKVNRPLWFEYGGLSVISLICL